MASCEKCWRDAGGSFETYQQLIDERKNNPCTPEKQAGVDAKMCERCERKTVHQYCKLCMVCGLIKK